MNGLVAFLRSIGPAIIVAAVVCGPGSMLMSSKTGAIYGYSMIWLVLMAATLMWSMVALSSSPAPVITRMSSPTASAGQKPITARGLIHSSATSVFSISWASSQSGRAASPITGSSSRSGNRPRSYQVAKNGCQSIRSTSSASG